jgi:hypothetical protein
MKSTSTIYKRNNQSFEIAVTPPDDKPVPKDQANVYSVQVFGNDKKLFYTGIIDVVSVHFLEKEYGIKINEFLTSAAKDYIDVLGAGVSSVL